MATENPQKFRLNFLKMLLIRRRKQVPLTVELSKPVTNPRYQGVPPTRSSEAMEWCPKRDGYVKDDFAEENLYLYTEGFRWTVENGRWHIKAVFGGEISSWAAWCWLDGTSHMHRKHIAPNHPDLWNLPRFMFFGWKTLTYVI